MYSINEDLFSKRFNVGSKIWILHLNSNIIIIVFIWSFNSSLSIEARRFLIWYRRRFLWIIYPYFISQSIHFLIVSFCNWEINPLLWHLVAKNIFLASFSITSLHFWTVSKCFIFTIDYFLKPSLLNTFGIWGHFCEHVHSLIFTYAWQLLYAISLIILGYGLLCWLLVKVESHYRWLIGIEVI